MPKHIFAVALATCLAPVTALANTAYDESASGDLSGVPDSPISITLVPGVNTVIGQTGDNGDTGATDGTDADYFGFTVPAGAMVTSLTVDSYAASGDSGGGSFIGYVAASEFENQFSVDSFVLFNATTGEIADDLGDNDMFGPGDHTFWIQETAAVTVDYQFSFTFVAAIPEPISLPLAAIAAGGALLRRRRA